MEDDNSATIVSDLNFLHLEEQDGQPFFVSSNKCTINLTRSYGNKNLVFLSIFYLSIEKRFFFDSTKNYENVFNDISEEENSIELNNNNLIIIKIPFRYNYEAKDEEIKKAKEILILYGFIKEQFLYQNEVD